MVINFLKFPWFKFKDRFSYEYNLRVYILPDIIRSEKRIVEYNIPGRSGTLFFDENSFENQTKTVEMIVRDSSQLDEIMEWLTGAGRVIFSNERDKYYEGFVRSQIIAQRFTHMTRQLSVQFDCQPFKYSVNSESDFISLTSPTNIFSGKGTWISRPTITIYGSGTITLTINSKLITLANVSNYITLNSEIESAYRDNVNLNNTMIGDFAVFLPNRQMNTINFTGNVTRIDIVPNWRWI